MRRFIQGEAIAPQETLVVCDDYALPLGAIRTRRRAAAMAATTAWLRCSERSARPKCPGCVSVSGPLRAGEDPADYVLSRFAPNEVASVEGLLARAVEAIETAVGHGVETAMNRFNRTPA